MILNFLRAICFNTRTVHTGLYVFIVLQEFVFTSTCTGHAPVNTSMNSYSFHRYIKAYS